MESMKSSNSKEVNLTNNLFENFTTEIPNETNIKSYLRLEKKMSQPTPYSPPSPVSPSEPSSWDGD